MSRIDVPTHLRRRDKFLFGLSGVQVIVCFAVVAAAWLVALAPPWPPAVRAAAALGMLAAGLALALAAPAGRTLDDWAVILATALCSRRALRYRKGTDRWDD